MGKTWSKVSLCAEDDELIEKARAIAIKKHSKIDPDYWSKRRVIRRALEYYVYT